MAQVEVTGFHWQTAPSSITSAAINSLSSELSSEIHAILDSLTTHPAPTTSKKEPCMWDEPSGLEDTYCNTQYSIHTTSDTPLHVHPFQMMQQTQYSIPSAHTMTPTVSPMSVSTCDPSAVNFYQDGTLEILPINTVSCTVELALPTHSQMTPSCAGVFQTGPPVSQYPTLSPCLPQLSHMQSQMPQLVGTTEHESSGKLEDMSWAHSTSQARSTLTMEDQHVGHDKRERSDHLEAQQLQMTEQPWNRQIRGQYKRQSISKASKVLGQPKKERSQLGQCATGDGMYQGMKLWQFLLQLLVGNKHPTILCWASKEEGTFRVIDSEALAKLWGRHKNRPEMNYDKMSRAMRYYYNKNLLDKVPRRLYYQFKYFSKWWEKLEAVEPDFKMIRIPKPPHSSSETTVDFLSDSDSERSDPKSPVCSDMEHDVLSPDTFIAIADNHVHSLC